MTTATIQSDCTQITSLKAMSDAEAGQSGCSERNGAIVALLTRVTASASASLGDVRAKAALYLLIESDALANSICSDLVTLIA